MKREGNSKAMIWRK